MKLTDFYSTTKIPVTSVNNKVGDVMLSASDVGAVSKKDVGLVVPILKNGIVPDTQLPNYAKVVNGKILSKYIPDATNERTGGIILGKGFEKTQSGIVNVVGTLTKEQKQQKVDIIKTDGDGKYVLADNGKYVLMSSSNLNEIQFSSFDENNDVSFDGKLQIVELLTQNNNRYAVQQSDVDFAENKTILHLYKFLYLQGLTEINSPWKAFYYSSDSIDMSKYDKKCKNIAFSQALIYG